jgi:3-hydroxy-9,10-secoandrosta-1,3,5(10)-triene-9,17-dione monooxygenase reductase component
MSAPTAAEWRHAMGYFPSGVTIVTTWDGEEPVGSTINAFCSVSLEPPLLLICLDLNNPIRGAFETCRVFGVNFLPEHGGAIARRFAREPLTDRFAEFAYRRAPGGAPQLDVAPMFIDCALQDIHLAGDHLIAVGRGVRIDERSDATPLLYHRGKFPKLAPPA